MGLTRLAEDPWSESHEVPTFTPPPVDTKSCYVPLTAQRAIEVVKTHIERQCTAQFGEPEGAAHAGNENGSAIQPRGRAGTRGGWAERGAEGLSAEGYGEDEILDDDGSGPLSPAGTHKLLDADLLDAWMRGAEEGMDAAAFADVPRSAASRSRPASSLGPLSRRLSCPEGLLQDDHAGGDPEQQDALEPLANHHTWMFNRSRWADDAGGAGLLYSASGALQAQQHHGSVLLGGADGWQPRDAASFFASSTTGGAGGAASGAPQLRRSRLSSLREKGASDEALRSLAAVIIQSYCRGWRARRQVARMRSAQRVEEARRKERAAAEALARERAAVRKQLRAAARDCLLAVQAQQDYERTRARLAAARGLGPGAAVAPPPEPPIIQPALWARCKALGQDPIQVLLDAGMMSHQIEDIISASQLASQLPKRAAATVAAARMSAHMQASGGGGGRVSGGGRSSGGGGASADDKGTSVSEDGGGGDGVRGGSAVEGPADGAAAAPLATPRISLPGRGGPLVPRSSAKQLQALQVGPASSVNTAQLVAQMLANQQQQQQQLQHQSSSGLAAGGRRQSVVTGSGMAAAPVITSTGGARPSTNMQATAGRFAQLPAQLSPLPHGGRGQIVHGPAAGGRNMSRRMSDFVGSSSSAMPPMILASSSSGLALAAIGSSAVVPAALPEGRAPPLRARSMGQEAGSAAAGAPAALAPVPVPQSLSPVRVVLPTLSELSDKVSSGATTGSSAGQVSVAMPDLPTRGSGGMASQQQIPPHVPQHVHPPLTSATNSPVARMGLQSSFSGFSDGSPAVRRRHSYVGSPGFTSSLPHTSPNSNNASTAGSFHSGGGGAPVDAATAAVYAAGTGAAAVALGRISSRGGHRSFTTASLVPQAAGAGALPPLLQAQGSWSGLHGNGSGGGSGSGASSGAASPVTMPSMAAASGAGGVAPEVPLGRLRRGSNLAPPSLSSPLAPAHSMSPHAPPSGAFAGSSPITIRRLQSLNSSSNSAAAAAAVVGATALSSSPTSLAASKPAVPAPPPLVKPPAGQ